MHEIVYGYFEIHEMHEYLIPFSVYSFKDEVFVNSIYMAILIDCNFVKGAIKCPQISSGSLASQNIN